MGRAVEFWTAALGYERRERDRDPEFMMLIDPAGRQLPVSLQLADGCRRNRSGCTWTSTRAKQERHVERLVTLGATRVDEWPYPDDADFVVLCDPDGNEFCVIDHPGQQAQG